MGRVPRPLSRMLYNNGALIPRFLSEIAVEHRQSSKENRKGKKENFLHFEGLSPTRIP